MVGRGERLQRGRGFRASLHGIEAARMKRAAGGRVQDRRRISRKKDAVAPGFAPGIGERDGADEGLGIGMKGMLHDIDSGADLDNFAVLYGDIAAISRHAGAVDDKPIAD